MTNKITDVVNAHEVMDQFANVLTLVVELTVTYVVHSTLSLIAAWLILVYLPVRFKRIDSQRPALMDAGWKLSAVLPLITSVLCVTTDMSPSFLCWSCRVPQARIDGSRQLDPSTFRSFVERTLSTDTHAESSVDLPPERASELPLSGAPIVSLSPSTQDHTTMPAIRRKSDIGEALRQRQLLPSLGDVPVAPCMSKSISRVDQKRRSLDPIACLGAAIVLWIAICLVRLAHLGRALSSLLRQCVTLERFDECDLHQLVPKGYRINFLRRIDGPRSVPYDAAPTGVASQKSHCLQPFACGVIHPIVVVPQEIEGILSPQELRALLGHEVAHLVRRDPIWQWVGETICSCLAFQPLNFVARRRWQWATEMLCDDWAVDHRISPTLLATCLTKVAEWRLDQLEGSSPRMGLGLQAVGPNGSLTSRMHWLLRSRRSAPVRNPVRQKVARMALVTTSLLIGAFGPRLTIDSSAQAARMKDHEVAIADDRETLEGELKGALEEFLHLQRQLERLDDPEIQEMANTVVQQFTKIMSTSIAID